MNNETTEPKKRGPKPKAKKDRVRAYPIGLTGAQITFLERAAKKAGVNVSEYIRTLIDADISA